MEPAQEAYLQARYGITVFMILIGIQRFAIEQWRDVSGRDTYGFLGHQFRQSEIISTVMIFAGIGLTAYLYSKYKSQLNSPANS